MSCTARHLASLTPYDCGRILAAVLQLVLFILLAASVCSAQPGRTNPFHNSAADIDTGRATFRIYCAPCHGIGAAGGSGPDLTLGVYEVGDSDEDLFEVIKDGVNGTEMQGFGERMNDNTIWRVVAYLRSVARKETPVLTGDASRGESIYQGKGGCAGCHRIAGAGGRLGPNLSRIGRTLSFARLREALVEPSKNIAKGFDTIAVVERDGEAVRGRQMSIDNFSVQLMDSREEIHSYLRDEVRSVEQEPKSLMPSYEGMLSGSEIDDVLAYLVSLRGDQ